MRIVFLFYFVPVGENSKKFYASVESVKALRYSNEIVLNFSEPDKDMPRFLQAASKAVSYAGKEIKIKSGDEIEIYAKPRELRIDNNNSSLETDLLKKGFHYIFNLNTKNCRVINGARIGLRDKIRNIIEENLSGLFDKRTVPVIKGLYFANSSYIDKSTTIDFKRAGVLHILAASGEHIGIIAGVLLLVLSPLFINRKILQIIIALVLLFYLYITDMPVSLLRAFVMFCIFSVQKIFDLEKNIYNTLFLSAVIILAMFPYEVFSLGFQLSFGATFGILLFYNFYRNVFSVLPSKLSQVLSVTFSAQIFVLPVIFIRLNEINLAGLVSNLVIVFTMSGTMILSIIAGVTSAVAMIPAKFFAFLTDSLYLLSLKLVQYFSGMKGHFAIDSGKSIALLLPFLLFILPAAPVKISGRILRISLIISVLSAWLILSGTYAQSKNRISISGADGKIIILQNENSSPVIFGYLNSYEEADEIAGHVNRNNIRNIILCIPKPDFNNLRSYTSFIKKSVVSGCYIAPDFMFSSHFKKFCRILDADGIPLKVSEFKTCDADRLIADNIPGFIENILQNPLGNIAIIHKLLTENYELKNSVMEEIEKCGFVIEYI